MNSNEDVDFNNANTRITRLYFSKIVEENILNLKDFRSIRKWCKENRVQIIKDATGEFVFQSEFDTAYNLPLIKKLTTKYGSEWQSYYPYYLKNEVYKIVELNQKSEPKPKGYVPKGSIALKFKNEQQN